MGRSAADVKLKNRNRSPDGPCRRNHQTADSRKDAKAQRTGDGGRQ